MRLLAFETSTEACSVALYLDGEIRERFAVAPRRHAELALPWAEQLLAEAGIGKTQLDVVAVGRGPGAFTGVRLGVALAQGIALALDLPVTPVSTLQALAAGAPVVASPQRILAAIDARMGEIYAACYQREANVWQVLAAERVLPPDRLELPGGTDWYAVGTGLGAVAGALASRMPERFVFRDPAALPRAAAVAALGAGAFARGEAVAPEHVEPAYLRNHVALTLREQQALRAARNSGGNG
ncbi:MAG: tRNA (adenosine(37)-N6)-threonylcarbamoyltransferase complex dimerization subunit type 1 TsaB [Xanthomonadaceae bacterium]|jgi:tRNA threonylcarbamoyladenosine biosynthesis protein TsaB|nr:tRNA (adenosine(37)-N6)-threonylcarbamoyltransferase complex dimerization subunit type 1 TsaB [Xanthomonadaceae bacterium]